MPRGVYPCPPALPSCCFLEVPLKPPSFPFYVNNWLASRRVSAMKPEQEGAYVRLLCHAWGEDDCGLPDDQEELAMLSRLNGRWAELCGPILKCFEKRDGRLFNERLLNCWKEAQEYRQSQSERANRRWHPSGTPSAIPTVCRGNAVALPWLN